MIVGSLFLLREFEKKKYDLHDTPVNTAELLC